MSRDMKFVAHEPPVFSVARQGNEVETANWTHNPVHGKKLKQPITFSLANGPSELTLDRLFPLI